MNGMNIVVYALVTIICVITAQMICARYAVDPMTVGFCCGIAAASIANFINVYYEV
jgi:hypothetical protein